ncbi:MAG: dimethylmenaquinone methyltransferase [Bryobacteraceae bacterium]|nr:dimethylmenaquinone methyltransferase [Bryobacteraceae bacterium]
MKSIARFAAVLAACLPLGAQVFQFSRDEMIKYTPKNPFERFEDGRPKVPDSLLERARALSAEDCWGVLRRANYNNNFEGEFRILHPNRKMAGRALTAMYMPDRPDLNELVMSGIKAKGFPRGGHQYVIDMLQPGDVLVVDAFGKTPGFVGDNLAAYIGIATKTGGLVVEGGVRDLQGLADLDTQIYYRFAHPDAVRGATLVGLNVPVRIGGVTVMPGDVIIGDREGITVVPPELIEQSVKGALEIFVHDEWTKIKLRTGKYKSHEIYGSPLDPALIKEYEEYKKKRMAELEKQ